MPVFVCIDVRIVRKLSTRYHKGPQGSASRRHVTNTILFVILRPVAGVTNPNDIPHISRRTKDSEDLRTEDLGAELSDVTSPAKAGEAGAAEEFPELPVALTRFSGRALPAASCGGGSFSATGSA